MGPFFGSQCIFYGVQHKAQLQIVYGELENILLHYCQTVKSISRYYNDVIQLNCNKIKILKLLNLIKYNLLSQGI